jgi:hypothetical protein
MDNQNPQPTVPSQLNEGQSVTPQPQTVAPANEQDKPKLDLSSSEAQSLLVLNNLQTSQQPKTKLPTKLLIVIIALILLVVITSFLVGAFKPGGTPKSSNPGGLGIPNQSDTNSGSGVSKQINQDVKSCSNPVNAATVC